MHTTRLYCAEELNCGEEFLLSAEASNHLIRVLRTKVNAPVTLFNGNGFDYQCTILDNNSRKTRLSIDTIIEIKNESNLHITLIQGLSRNDRIETSIQKSIELGANRIIPVICQRSNTKTAKEKAAKKLTHWKKIAISACEQSGRCSIPEVTDIVPLNHLSQLLDDDALNITLNPQATTSLSELASNYAKKKIMSIQVFIGPEGGLSDEEITSLQEDNFTDIYFGPRILRTETAGPAVISALQLLWGDF